MSETPKKKGGRPKSNLSAEEREKKEAEREQYLIDYYAKNKEIIAQKRKAARAAKRAIADAAKIPPTEEELRIKKEETKRRKKEAGDAWRQKNAETLKAKQKEYYEKNKEAIKQRQREYNKRISEEKAPHYLLGLEKAKKQRAENPEPARRTEQKYRKSLSEEKKALRRVKNATRARAKRKECPIVKALECSRARMKKLLIRALGPCVSDNKGSFFKHFGCSPSEFKSHIERLFQGDMTWENRGKLWHLDHIVPFSASLGVREHMLKLNHYKNLRPLFVIDNVRKGDSMPEVWPEGVPFTREEVESWATEPKETVPSTL